MERMLNSLSASAATSASRAPPWTACAISPNASSPSRPSLRNCVEYSLTVSMMSPAAFNPVCCARMIRSKASVKSCAIPVRTACDAARTAAGMSSPVTRATVVNCSTTFLTSAPVASGSIRPPWIAAFAASMLSTMESPKLAAYASPAAFAIGFICSGEMPIAAATLAWLCSLSIPARTLSASTLPAARPSAATPASAIPIGPALVPSLPIGPPNPSRNPCAASPPAEAVEDAAPRSLPNRPPEPDIELARRFCASSTFS